MGYFLLALGILIILDISYFSFINQGNMLLINYKPFIPDFELNSGLLYFTIGVYGFIGGILITYSKVLKIKQDVKKFKRKTEKSEIQSEESSDQIKQLESKIQTLETALKASLEKK